MKYAGLCAIGILVSVGPLAVDRGYAGEGATKCTLATLNGQYLFNGTGTLFPPAFGVTSASTGTSAGFHIFNGDETGTDFVAFSINGTIVVPSSSTPITYTLNPDCTGTYQVPSAGSAGLNFDIFVSIDGSALITIETDVGVAERAAGCRHRQHGGRQHHQRIMGEGVRGVDKGDLARVRRHMADLDAWLAGSRAVAVGYSSGPAFGAAFRSVFGITPVDRE